MSTKLQLYESYLRILNKFENYESYLKNKKHNLTNIKLYFNHNIFISVVDFKNGNYILHGTKSGLINYIRNNPKKKVNRNDAKSDKYGVFLKKFDI